MNDVKEVTVSTRQEFYEALACPDCGSHSTNYRFGLKKMLCGKCGLLFDKPKIKRTDNYNSEQKRLHRN